MPMSRDVDDPFPNDDPASADGLSRRKFLKLTGAALPAGTLLGPEAIAVAAAAAGAPPVVGPEAVAISLRVNGRTREVNVEPRATLLDTLRDSIGLTGAKRVCDRGTCGACTVLVDDMAVYSCSMLAVEAQGKRITTIEGLAPANELHAISAAFVTHDAQQCGFCTPGFVVATKAFLDHNPNASEEDVNNGLGGNLCRCGTYVGIRKAAVEAARRIKGGPA
jgi:xanthine dehydrogenase YagT iron-sulfur-binding subunit